ncbi:MAG: hypothetical protein KDA44_15335 [Planctomycetales bacterium]|nr:hypothetical protein [Planctomycetales bacterium]
MRTPNSFTSEASSLAASLHAVRPLALAGWSNVESRNDGVLIKIATNRGERAGAFELAYRSYSQAGLCGLSRTAMRISSHQLLPCTDVFVALQRGEVISTLSLVRDGGLGLPLEAIYPDEVRSRRNAGLRLGEVTCLADRHEDKNRFLKLFPALTRVMMQTAEREGIDQLLIAVHPRHARFYRQAMGFQQIAGHRRYQAVNGNPALALSLDLKSVRTQQPRIWQRFVGAPLPAEVLQSCPVTESDRRYFAEAAFSQRAA